jgi:hypothetical protein
MSGSRQAKREDLMTEISELRELSPEQIVEVANGILAAKLRIEDPASAAQRVAELAGLNAAKAGEIEILAREAAKSDPDLLGELLAGALNNLAESEPESLEAIQQAAEAAGEKLTVVGLDLLALGYLVLCGYIVIKRVPEEEKKTITIKEQKDGRLELKIDTTKKFINPLTSVGKLLGAIWSKA